MATGTGFNAVNAEQPAQTPSESKGPSLAASMLNELGRAEAGLFNSPPMFTSDTKTTDGRATVNNLKDLWASQTDRQVDLGNLPKLSLV